MKKTRTLNLLGLFFNLVIIGSAICGIYLLMKSTGNNLSVAKYYNVIAADITLLASTLMIFANIVNIKKGKDRTPRLMFSLRFISAVMSFITFLVIILVICPYENSYQTLINVKDGALFLHLICPVASFVSFIFFDIEPSAKFKKTFEPFIATILYSAGILISMFAIFFTQGADAAKAFIPYKFLRVMPQVCDSGESYVKNIIVTLIVIVAAYVFSIIIWGLNRIMSSIVIGVELNKEIKNEENKKADVDNVVKNKETTPNTNKTINKVKKYIVEKVKLTNTVTPSSNMCYHISYHNRKLRTWKVKSEGALRAVKVFNTQKEAIDYANSLVSKNGGSIRIHSMVGKIRKEW